MQPEQSLDLCGRRCRFSVFLELPNYRTLRGAGKGIVLTKALLPDELYDGTVQPDAKIIDVFVCKLRKQIAQATGGARYIETAWGSGYVLCDPAATKHLPTWGNSPPRRGGGGKFQGAAGVGRPLQAVQPPKSG